LQNTLLNLLRTYLLLQNIVYKTDEKPQIMQNCI